MSPEFMHGSLVVSRARVPQKGDVVLARAQERDVIKRVKSISNDAYYLVGDNSHESTDSRHYGSVPGHDILGVIVMKLPLPVAPPKPLKPYATQLGIVLAITLIVSALIHLFRIDTFIPVLDSLLPSGRGFATSIALLIILSEVFAVPFALRMRLSPLAHLVSGALVVLAPLWWVLLSIWGIGLPYSTGQVGAFIDTPSNTLLLSVNVAWLALSYYGLYVLGYNKLTVRSLLSK